MGKIYKIAVLDPKYQSNTLASNKCHMKPESDAQVSNTLTYLFWPVQTAIKTQSEKQTKR